MDRVCPICGKEIKENRHVKSCTKCGALHHPICYKAYGCGECSFANRPYRPTKTAPRIERKDYATADKKGFYGIFFKNTGRSIKKMAKALLAASVFVAAVLTALGVYFTVTEGSAWPAIAGCILAVLATAFLIAKARILYALGERTENSAKMLNALSDIEYRLAKAENKHNEGSCS